MDTTQRRGIEQGRAKFAYDCAESASKKKFSKEYKAYAKKIPMLIKTNGLGATFAFIQSKTTATSKAKSNLAYAMLYQHTAVWLQSDGQQWIALSDGEKLAGVLVDLPSPEYRAVTAEVLALFNWLRRFADGLIEGEVEDTSR